MPANENEVNLRVNWIVSGQNEIKNVQNNLDDLGASSDSKGKKSTKTFKELTEQVVDNYAKLGDFGKICVSAASKLGVMTVAGTLAIGTIKRIAVAAMDNAKIFTASSSAISDLNYQINAYTSTTMDYAELLKEVNAVFDTDLHPASKITSMLAEAIDAVGDLTVAEELVNLAFREQTISGRDAETCLKDLINAYIKAGNVISDTGESITDFDTRMETVRQNIEAISNSELGYIKDADDRFRAITEKWKNWIGEFGAYVGAFFKNIISNVLGLIWDVGELLSDLFTGDWKEIKGDFENIGKNFSGPEGAVTAGGIGAGIGGIIGAIVGGPAGAVIGADLGGLLTGTIASILGNKAEGGPIYTSGLYEVGEQGPETVYLPQGSFVYPNRSNSSVTVNVAVSGSVWTSRDLGRELLSVFEEQLRLRGAY